MRRSFDRVQRLKAKGWMHSPYGPVEVVIVDFFINNRGRINNHEFGGMPLYWVKVVRKRDRRKERGFIVGHAHYGNEIYPRREQALGSLV